MCNVILVLVLKVALVKHDFQKKYRYVAQLCFLSARWNRKLQNSLMFNNVPKNVYVYINIYIFLLIIVCIYIYILYARVCIYLLMIFCLLTGPGTGNAAVVTGQPPGSSGPESGRVAPLHAFGPLLHTPHGRYATAESSAS